MILALSCVGKFIEVYDTVVGDCTGNQIDYLIRRILSAGEW